MPSTFDPNDLGLDHPEFPTVPKILLDELDKRFPLRCPDLRDSEREIFKMVGERTIIEFLREQYRLQTETFTR